MAQENILTGNYALDELKAIFTDYSMLTSFKHFAIFVGMF